MTTIDHEEYERIKAVFDVPLWGEMIRDCFADQINALEAMLIGAGYEHANISGKVKILLFLAVDAAERHRSSLEKIRKGCTYYPIG